MRTSSKPEFPELMDGGVLHNNPVNVAMAEARQICLASNQTPTPDIVLSLGTGLPKEHSDDFQDQKDANLPRLSFFRKMITLVQYQIQLNLDAESRWRQHAERYHDNSDWEQRLFRLNPDLKQEPPNMDDVDMVEPLKLMVTGWLDGERVKAQINEICGVLVASSFYFQPSGSMRQGNEQGSMVLKGVIKCRLSDRSELRALGAFLASCYPPSFVLIEPSGRRQHIETSLQDMQNFGQHRDIPLEVDVPAGEALTTLALQLPGLVPNGQRIFNLSGFPRDLANNDFKFQ